MEKGLNVSFSLVKFYDIARFVGLDRHAALRDIDNFKLHRYRIPTALFKAMVNDMDLMFMRLTEHQTKEASSRFIAPVRASYSLDRITTASHSPDCISSTN